MAQVEWHNQLQSETDSRHGKPEFCLLFGGPEPIRFGLVNGNFQTVLGTSERLSGHRVFWGLQAGREAEIGSFEHLGVGARRGRVCFKCTSPLFSGAYKS